VSVSVTAGDGSLVAPACSAREPGVRGLVAPGLLIGPVLCLFASLGIAGSNPWGLPVPEVQSGRGGGGDRSQRPADHRQDVWGMSDRSAEPAYREPPVFTGAEPYSQGGGFQSATGSFPDDGGWPQGDWVSGTGSGPWVPRWGAVEGDVGRGGAGVGPKVPSWSATPTVPLEPTPGLYPRGVADDLEPDHSNWRFRGDPPARAGDWRTPQEGQYRFRPLSDQELGRQEEGPRWRPLTPGARPAPPSRPEPSESSEGPAFGFEPVPWREY